MVIDLAFAIGLAMGCGGTPMDQQIPTFRSHNYRQRVDTLGVEAFVPAPSTRVWEILPAVLTDLGLEINFREPATKRIGSCYQKTRVRLGKENLSTFVDCGDSRGLPNADRYEVALTVLVTVVPTSSTTTKIFTFLLGVGLDASGAASDRLWCFSRGVLEQRIRTALEERTRS